MKRDKQDTGREIAPIHYRSWAKYSSMMSTSIQQLCIESDAQRVNVAVLGAPGVGKTSIIKQFVSNHFQEGYEHTDKRCVYYPSVIINDRLYQMKIIDCPVIPYFPVNSLYEWTDFRGFGLRNAKAYILVFDLTNDESFHYIKSLREQILESRENVLILIVGNKHDLNGKKMKRSEARANVVKKQWKCSYVECSAKYNWHIVSLFKDMMKTIDTHEFGQKPTSVRVQAALRRNSCCIL